MSIVSAGCLLWLERLQPVFAVVAVSALAYQGWLIRRRPRHLRMRAALLIFWSSLGLTVLIFAVWIGLALRYR
ncbi:MAG TPA: hypothetical protein VNI83_00515 [Vicinamibacterales bacterium]|nr:hypothetical protein [Vicinamibacterales bacterium]